MKLFITGGTGFIGGALTRGLAEAGHEPLVLVRPGERAEPPAGVKFVEGDPLREGPWWDAVSKCEGAINLAGEPIQGRWNVAKKRAIRESRMATTANLVRAVPQGGPFTLLSTSAVGIYGNAGDRLCDESAPTGKGFLADVARQWEEEAKKAEAKGARVVVTRFGVVLGPGGGALREFEKLSKSFIGGPVGGGRQWFSWIHRDDLIQALLFLISRKDLRGIFNICSPNPVTQGDLARALGKILQKPSFMPTPALMVRLALGESADFVLFSQRMVPARLSEAGFRWRYPEIEGALRAALGKPV